MQSISEVFSRMDRTTFQSDISPEHFRATLPFPPRQVFSEHFSPSGFLRVRGYGRALLAHCYQVDACARRGLGSAYSAGRARPTGQGTNVNVPRQARRGRGFRDSEGVLHIRRSRPPLSGLRTPEGAHSRRGWRLLLPGGRVRPPGSGVRLRGPEDAHARRGRGSVFPDGRVCPSEFGTRVRLHGPEVMHARRSGRRGGRCSPAGACARRGLGFSCANARARQMERNEGC